MASMKEGEPKIADEGTEAASWVEEEERRLKAEEDAFVAEQEALPPIQRKDALAGWVFKRGGFKSKAYKKRLKLLKEKQYTQEEADAAAGLGKEVYVPYGDAPVNTANVKPAKRAPVVAEKLNKYGRTKINN